MKLPSQNIFKVAFGIGIAAVFGFLQGVGIEEVLTKRILDALQKGDVVGIAAYALVFILIWIEVRGLKKEVGKLNGTISNSFAEGEKKFNDIEHRLTVLEEKQMAIN